MAEARVAVIIAAWNAETTLERALRSALAQTVPVEVIVVDDASTDGTFALARRLAAEDGRVTALRQEVNAGPSAARNRAIAASRAPWIATLDSDDFMDPGRLARLIAVAEAEGADFVADDLWKVDQEDPEGPRVRLWSDTDFGQTLVTAPMFIEGNISARYGGRREIGFLKPLMSRAFLDRHGISFEPEIRLGEDFVLYATALIEGAKFLLIDPAGYVAVVRAGSLSGKHPTEAHARLIAADDVLLARSDLDTATRRALERHRLEQQKKHAWRVMIDANRERNFGKAAGAFFSRPAVMADLSVKLWGEVTARLPGGKKADRWQLKTGR